MRGLLSIAYRLLITDRARYATLLLGISTAVFLMISVTSVFAGVLRNASALVTNIGASMWVMDPSLQAVANSIPLPDGLLDEVRSLPGVKYAVPLYSGLALLKLQSGFYQAVTIIGLDDASLMGRPQLPEGRIEDLFAENAFIAVEDSEFPKLQNPHVGTEFELNDHRGVIVGIATVPRTTLFGIPTLYTTYNRARQYIPNSRFTMSYVLVEPKRRADMPRIAHDIAALGYLALTKQAFISKNTDFYLYHTGVGVNLLVMTLVSLIMGLSISGQTFYAFVLENIDRFATLKAIGTSVRALISMIVFQATLVALTGYGIGAGASVVALWVIRHLRPDYAAATTYLNLALAVVMVCLIAALSSYIGIRILLRIEPFDLFRR
jgi:putative ABC transport system permease protein